MSEAAAELTSELNPATVVPRSGWICAVVLKMVPAFWINLVVSGSAVYSFAKIVPPESKMTDRSFVPSSS